MCCYRAFVVLCILSYLVLCLLVYHACVRFIACLALSCVLSGISEYSKIVIFCYTFVVDNLLDNFFLLVDNFMDILCILCVRLIKHVFTRFTQVKCVRKHVFFYAKNHINYILFRHYLKYSDNSKQGKSLGNIHYPCFFMQKSGGYFQKWKHFPEKKLRRLTTSPLSHKPTNTTPFTTTRLITQIVSQPRIIAN